MKKVLSVVMFSLSALALAQTGKLWKKANTVSNRSLIEPGKLGYSNPRLYSLDIESLKFAVQSAPKSTDMGAKSSVVVSFPSPDGKFEDFRIFEKSNFEPALQAQNPDIRSYVGESVFGNAKIYFSLSPLGFSSLEMTDDKGMVVIESYTTDASTYMVFNRTDDSGLPKKFECKVSSSRVADASGRVEGKSADDGLLRTYRLALSCTGEYGAYFGGATGALAGMNATMTRVNAVFENEFAIHMNLIPEVANIIFTNASTDPYSAASTGASGAWSDELKAVLKGTTYGIGDAKYDIGHLFGRTGGGGSAGCIGCVCNSTDTFNTTYEWYEHKGQGFTSPASGSTPVGDNFDIDYVAHEMGHQFGGWHTFTHGSEGNPSQMEPGSGSTIMGYAGITSKDVQPHSDAYFHSASVRDVTTYMKGSVGNCGVKTTTGNTAPVANAGADYTIPRSTPFMLTGAGTDADNDAITYNWEQFDNQNASTANPTATKTSGVNFRSYTATSSPVRYFPVMASILTGSLFTAGTEINVEYLPSVARTLNFRLTVRDSRIGGAANSFDDMKVTVNAASGPFAVTSPNTAVTYAGNSSQTITWDVASTTASPVNCANVDILISTNGGTTWTTLLANTPNDGTQAVTMPNIATTTARIMVKANGNIFFDVSNANFTITQTTMAVSDVNSKTIQIFPNPVKETLNVSNVTLNSNYEIYSAAGQLVSKGHLGTGKISVSSLPKGVYFLNVDDKGTAVKTKFVKD